MLAYAASRPIAGKRQSSPNALLLVISAHVALVAVVMSAKMDLPIRVHHDPPTIIDFVPPLADPPPQPQPIAHPIPTPTPQPLRPLPVAGGPIPSMGPIDAGPIHGGDGIAVNFGPSNPIKLAPIRHEPQLLTPFSELKPPYPASKLASEEEAVLTLRLSIDDSGRVVAVDPVGRADKIFVDAARRHMIAHWRYSPATQDGQAVASSITVTLRFMLDG